MVSVIKLGTQWEEETITSEADNASPEPGLCEEEGHDAEPGVSDESSEDEDCVEIEPESMEQYNPSQTTDDLEMDEDNDNDDEPVNFKRFGLNVNFTLHKCLICLWTLGDSHPTPPYRDA